MNKDRLIEQLILKVEALTQRVEQLEKENQYLKARLLKYETPKNSSNSSIAPSKDENRPKRRSLREKSNRNPGGQKGRKGNTLKMVETPDEVIKHIPDYCNCCGRDLSSLDYHYIGKRQVHDIPQIKLKVTEHQIYKRICQCGRESVADYPSQANAPVSYGNNIESLIGYFHTRQYLPFLRMKEMFNDVFNVPISEGGIHYLLNKLTQKSYTAYHLIKQRLKNTDLPNGSDETGVKVNGNKHWAWTWQNEEATFITITDNRGQDSIDNTFKDGFENSILVHDCWKSHFNTPCIDHQICIAHLLRDLNYLSEKYNHKWSRICKAIFMKALDLKREMTDDQYRNTNAKRTSILKRFEVLLNTTLPKEHKELISFRKRMVKYKDYLFTFLYHPKVPPDNNASERAIRNIKVKQKISGQFKSEKGADTFAMLRSITDTCIKNGQNVIQSLNLIANLQTD